MATTTRIICLANSKKHGEGCVAGIEPATGRWIRPVTSLSHGEVPKHTRQIGRTEPALLDLLDIPLAPTGPDFGFESENRLILPGAWHRAGRVQPTDLRTYYSTEPYVLHNSSSFVLLPYMQALPFAQRRTLELVETTTFSAEKIRRDGGWRGALTTCAGQRVVARITDVLFLRRLDAGHRPGDHCLLTMSLGMPYRPPEWDGDDPCWKLIAAVIELDPTAAASRDDDLDLSDIPF